MDAKVHQAGTGESFETRLRVPVKNGVTVNDVLTQFEEVTMNTLKVFVDGEAVDRKAKVQKAIRKGSKVLLFGGLEMKNMRPEGVRWWGRFPTHEVSDNITTGSNEQSIVYVPIQDDIEVYGYGLYRHSSSNIDYMEVRMRVRVHNENDDEEPILFEKQFDTVEVTYDQMQWDEH